MTKLIQSSTTEVLILKLKETLGNMKLSILNVSIQEELEKRIGEDKVDEILYEN